MIFGFSDIASKPAKAFDPDEVEAEVVLEDDDLRDKMRTVMPWIFSFLAHLGVLILASLIAFGIKKVIEEKPAVVPLAEMGDEDITGPLDRLPGPETGVIAPMSDGAPPPPPDAVAPPMPSTTPPPVGATKVAAFSAISKFAAPTSMVAAAAGVGQSDHGAGIFRGVGGFIGGGGQGGGQKAANRIVFLVDASGSLVDTLPFVLEDLRRMLDSKMDPKKSFNVIFFSGREVNRDIGVDRHGVSSLFGGLEPADPANRKKAMEWIRKVEAGGSSDPLAAIQEALAMDPDQIHLLSDNITGSGIWEVHQEKFMAEVMKAYNKAIAKRVDAKTKITFRIAFKTYQFVYKDPMETIGKTPTLYRLVKETGGVPEQDYRFVTARELGLR